MAVYIARRFVNLIPTFLLITVGVGVVHHTASVQELRDYATRKGPDAAEAGKSLLQKLKQSIEEIVPRTWLQRIDPLNEDLHLRCLELSNQIGMDNAE